MIPKYTHLFSTLQTPTCPMCLNPIKKNKEHEAISQPVVSVAHKGIVYAAHELFNNYSALSSSSPSSSWMVPRNCSAAALLRSKQNNFAYLPSFLREQMDNGNRNGLLRSAPHHTVTFGMSLPLLPSPSPSIKGTIPTAQHGLGRKYAYILYRGY
jgi:hypothetical protein